MDYMKYLIIDAEKIVENRSLRLKTENTAYKCLKFDR